MSRKRQRRTRTPQPASTQTRRRSPAWTPVYVTIAGLVILTIVVVNAARPGRSGSIWDRPARVAKTSPAAAGIAGDEPPAAQTAQYEPLLGRWLRGDGDYEIDVASVSRSGEADVSYFNPQPIRVSDARASQEADHIALFVELQDVGYPRCTYRLDYDPEHDRLEGVYYQAALQQEIPVTFVRSVEY